MWAGYKFCVIVQGHNGLPGIRGPKGEKVCFYFVVFVFIGRNMFNLFCYRSICAYVLVFLSALMNATSPPPPICPPPGRNWTSRVKGEPLLPSCMACSLTHLSLVHLACPWNNGIWISLSAVPSMHPQSLWCDLSIDVLRISSAAAKWVMLH